MSDFLSDARYGLRRVVRRPAVSLTLVLTFGLSIGANVAIFTVINALLIKEPPYRSADRLVLVRGLPIIKLVTSISSFDSWKSESGSLQDAAPFALGEATALGGAQPEHLQVAVVSSNFFSVLGVEPRLGNGFPAGNEPSSPSVIVSSRLWRRDFGSAHSLSGLSIILNRQKYSVIGVAPETCDYPVGTDVWTTGVYDLSTLAGFFGKLGPILARVKPGFSLRVLESQEKRWLRDQNLDPSEMEAGDTSPKVSPLRTELVGDFKTAALLLFAAVTLVLLIGCANVANLIMADFVIRRREFAIRRALGMGRGRLARQILTEQLLLALLGGAVGLVGALITLPYLRNGLPPSWPRFATLSLDARVFGFALGLSVLVGAALAVTPCLGAWRDAKLGDVTASRTSEPPRSKRGREVLVAVETTLALVLMVNAFLLVESARSLVRTDLGFRPSNVLTATVSRDNSTDLQRKASREFYEQLVTEARSLQGVHAAGGVYCLPLKGLVLMGEVKAVPLTGAAAEQVGSQVVTQGYFHAMGIPIIAGRDFNDFDLKGSEHVAVIDSLLADKLWPGSDPLGRQISDDDGIARVVGVVGAVRESGPDQEPLAEVYRPLTQASPPPLFSLVVLTSSRSPESESAVRSLVARLDPSQPVEIRRMDSYVADVLWKPRTIAGLLTALSAIGLALAVVGLYGLVSFTLAARNREFGIRVALGEKHGVIFIRTVGSALRAALPGVVVGLLASIALARLFRSLVFGVSPTDAGTLAAAATLMILVAASAGALAARRIRGIDPIAILREE